MKNIITLIFCLFPAFVYASNAKYYKGSFALSYGEVSNGITLPESGLQPEGTLRFAYPILKNISLRSSISYNPSLLDDEPIKIEHLLVEFVKSSWENQESYGFRLGRVPTPYGMYNHTRDDPYLRIMPLVTPGILWPVASGIYDGGDGYHLFAKKVILTYLFDFELGEIIRKNLIPKENYLWNIIGMDPVQVRTRFAGLTVVNTHWKLRFSELMPVETINIKEEHWKKQIKIMPRSMWVLGEKTVEFRLSYLGMEYYLDKWKFSAERVLFYTGGESGDNTMKKYYEVLGDVAGKFPSHVNMFLNFITSYRISNSAKVLVGATRKTHDQSNDLSGRDNYVSVDWFYDKYHKFSAMRMSSTGNYWMSKKHNPDWGTRITTGTSFDTTIFSYAQRF